MMGQPEAAIAAPKKSLFALDRSPSMGGWKLQAAKDAIISVLDGYGPKDMAAILVFDQGAQMAIQFTTCDAAGKDRLENAIRGIQLGDGTNYYPALELALKQFGKPDPKYKNLINFASDGEDFDHRDPVSMCDQLRSKGVGIYTGGIGMHPDHRDKLIAMAKGQFAPANSTAELGDFFAGVDAQISLAGVTNARVVLAPVDFVTVGRFHGATKGDDGNYIKPDGDGKTVILGDIAPGDHLGCFAQLQVTLPGDIDKELKPKTGDTKAPKESIRKAFGYIRLIGDAPALGLINHVFAEEPIVVKFALTSSATPNEDVVTFYRVANSVYELSQGNVDGAVKHMAAAAQTQAFSHDRVAQALAAKVKSMGGMTDDQKKEAAQGATVAFDPRRVAAAKARQAKK
jgi:hypothetical protein